MVSGLEHHEHADVKGVPLKNRASRRSQAPGPIGGDSSVWTPKPCRLSSSSSSLVSSCYSSSSLVPSSCAPRRSRHSGCNPCFPAAVAPLNPVTPCDPLYGPGYGAFPGPCGSPCGFNPPGPVGPAARLSPFGLSPCGPGPCAAVKGRAQPWYIYLTATFTSTYSITASIVTSTEVDSDTVSYTIFTIDPTNVPNAYYSVSN